MKPLWVAGGVSLYFLFMIVAFPVADYLPTLVPNRISLKTINGSVFHGDAEVVLSEGEKGRVSWTLKPMSIFQLHPAYKVHFERSGMNITGRVDLNPFEKSITLTHVDGRVEIEKIFPELPINSLHISFGIELMSFSHPTFSCNHAHGNIRIKRLESTLLERNEFPEQNGKIKCSEGELYMILPVKHPSLKGEVVAKLNEYSYLIKFKMVNTKPAFHQLLSFSMGPPLSSGYFYREFTGIY